MNIKLLDSLVNMIDLLTAEERELLESRIQSSPLDKIEKKDLNKREEIVLEPTLDEYIFITRNERTATQDELINICFRKDKN